jgi:hypothetical protein
VFRRSSRTSIRLHGVISQRIFTAEGTSYLNLLKIYKCWVVSERKDEENKKNIKDGERKRWLGRKREGSFNTREEIEDERY